MLAKLKFNSIEFLHQNTKFIFNFTTINYFEHTHQLDSIRRCLTVPYQPILALLNRPMDFQSIHSSVSYLFIRCKREKSKRKSNAPRLKIDRQRQLGKQSVWKWYQNKGRKYVQLNGKLNFRFRLILERGHNIWKGSCCCRCFCINFSSFLLN